MHIIITAIYIFAISIIILSFLNFKLSIAVYISYLILVPYLQLPIAGVTLSYNFVNTFLFLVFLYHYNIKLNFQLITPFLFLYLSLFFLSLFTWGMPWILQFNYWRGSIMQTCILSFIIWNIAFIDEGILVYIKWTLIISILIACMYGLFLTQLDGNNPYTSLLANYFGYNDVAEIYLSTAEMRMSFSNAAKIQSTLVHPMTWALVLCFVFIIFFAFKLKSKNKLYWLLLGLVGFNILTSGARTGIAALTIGFFFFLILQKKLKQIVLSLVFISAISLTIQFNDDLTNLAKSFVDVSGNESDVTGSSISMRLNQLQGAFDELRGHEVVGKGYNWNCYYQLDNGDHPVLLAFESLLFIVLCNSGLMGVIIWITFFLLLFRLHHKLLKEKESTVLMDIIVIVYIAFTLGTGEYDYIQFFAILYTFLLSYLFNNQKIKISCKY